MTTVGYGDRYPVTDTGRMVAVGLEWLLSGIALLGIVTATFASWLIDRVSEVDEAAQAATRADIAALSAQVAELRAAIEADRA